MPEPSLDVVRRLWLPFLALLLLLLLLIRLEAQSADSDHGQKDANEPERFAGQMSDFVTGLSAWVDMQNKLIGKIENLLSGKMSPEWEDRLKNLEVQVENSNQWPKEDDTKQFSGEVSDLSTSLSPWAEANYLPRLLLVRWAATAFNYLDDSQNPDTLPNASAILNALAMVEDMRSWADAKPDGNASDLDQKLQEKASRIENRQIDKAIEWAERHLKKDANTQRDLPETGYDIESIADFLGRHENNRAQNDQKRNKIASLRKKLESELYREVEARQDEARKAYQKWALKEIKAFKGEFKNVIDGAGPAPEKAKKGDWWWSRLSSIIEDVREWIEKNFGEKDYKKIQDAMICHLLPVDLALLDLPVLKLYHQAFDNGWYPLDGCKEQNCVAESSAS